jgi:hypothetical protein
MKKVTLLLIGGIGNRLFQLAYGLSVQELRFGIDIVELPVWVEKFSRIFGWSYHSQWLDIQELSGKFGFNKRRIKTSELLKSILIYLARQLGLNLNKFDEPPLKVRDKDFLVGYFQSSEHCSKRALDKICLSLVEQLQIKKSNNVSVHLRGGDFRTLDRVGAKIMSEKIKGYSNLNIVTDDVVYAKTLLKNFSDWKIYHSRSALNDFKFLASSAVIFPSNSTFAYWASRIVQMNGGKVITFMPSELWKIH